MTDPLLDLEIETANEILRELDTPSVRLDSVGLLVISDAPLPNRVSV
jgi:hypothetical protein